MEPSRPPTHYATLDAWRGLAAIAVVSFHAFNPWIIGSSPPSLAWLTRAVGHGFLGVHLFFVVSGYCIAQIALREIRTGQDPMTFLRNRFLRIFPPYWIACIIAGALALAALPFNHRPLIAETGFSGALPSSFPSAIGHFLLIDPWVNQQPFLLVAWTLSWEISFYLMTTVLIVVGIYVGLRTAVVLALLVAVLGTWSEITNTLPVLGGWAEFICGACTFAALDARRNDSTPWPWIAVLTAFIVTGIFKPNDSSRLCFSSVFALLLVGSHQFDGVLARTRLAVWLARLGLFSYSIYLIHVPVLSPLRNMLARWLPPESPYFIVVIFTSAALSITAAWFFYRAVENPLEFRRRQIGRPPAPPPP